MKYGDSLYSYSIMKNRYLFHSYLSRGDLCVYQLADEPHMRSTDAVPEGHPVIPWEKA